MTTTDVLPLSPWANRARLIFLTSWTLVPMMRVLESYGVLDRHNTYSIALRIVVAVVWTLAGTAWGIAEYQRRHLNKKAEATS